MQAKPLIFPVRRELSGSVGAGLAFDGPITVSGERVDPFA
jgi:hypothetical protein